MPTRLAPWLTIGKDDVSDSKERFVELGVHCSFRSVTRALNSDGNHGDQKCGQKTNECWWLSVGSRIGARMAKPT